MSLKSRSPRIRYWKPLSGKPADQCIDACRPGGVSDIDPYLADDHHGVGRRRLLEQNHRASSSSRFPTSNALLPKPHSTLLVTSWVHTVMYIAEGIQAYHYFKTYPTDSLTTRIFVAVCCLVDTAALAGHYAGVYLYAVKNWGNTAYFLLEPWTAYNYLMTTSVTAFIVQTYLIRRCWRVMPGGKSRLALTFVLVCSSWLTMASAVALTIKSSQHLAFDDRSLTTVLALIWLIGSACTDILIAFTLVWHLYTMGTGLSRETKSVLFRLIRTTLQSGVFTAAAAILVIVIYLTDTASNANIGVGYLLGRLYTLTLLLNLNKRPKFGLQHTVQQETMDGGDSDVQWEHRSQSESRSRSRSRSAWGSGSRLGKGKLMVHVTEETVAPSSVSTLEFAAVRPTYVVGREGDSDGSDDRLAIGPSDWIGPSLFTARTISAAVEGLPFPYVRSVFGLVVVLLETIESGKKNRQDLRELCRDVEEVMYVVKDQVTAHRDTAAPKFKGLCEDLEACLQDVLRAVKVLQIEPRGLHGRFREVVRLAGTAEQIVRYHNRIRNLRSNVMLAATMDTNFQIHKLTPMISEIQAIQKPPRINTCPPPSRIFQGRKGILDKLYDFFSESAIKQHVFLLHGLGGAGKTQIALTFIEEESPLFTGIFFIDASTKSTIEAGLSDIAIAKTSGRTPREALPWLHMTQEKWLLFFDNADDPQVNLNAFFPRCRHGNVLITSRNPGLAVYAGANHRVSDMDETDAVPLLLTSAAQDDTPENNKIAAEIVKELSYLPLAIVQAGAFISRSDSLDMYLSLYHTNKACLLSEVPTQSHDDYAWTVYTTWQISFDRLSPTAAMLLQLCSFLHQKGISEKIFSAAADYQVQTCGPKREEIAQPLEFLSQNPTAYKACMTSIIAMQVTAVDPQELDLAAVLLPHIDALLPEDAPLVPAFDLEYGALHHYTGRFGRAEKLLVAALATRHAALGDDHFDTLLTMNYLAATYLLLGCWREAERLREPVARKGTAMLGPDNPYVLIAVGSLAAIYTKLGREDEALELQIGMVERSKKAMGEDHINTVTAIGNLGVMLMNVGRLRGEAPEMLAAMSNLGRVYAKSGRLERAEEIQLQVLQRTREMAGEDSPDTLLAMGNIAVTYRDMGRLDEAERIQAQLLPKRKELLGEGHPDTLAAMVNLAWTYNLLGRFAEAGQLLFAAVERQRATLGDDDPVRLKRFRQSG
ncbi:hypothetical protein FB45DRAFT_1082759 [Roridomyces roridus]|uniref:DUF6534 domain-containing protein n=1 Tax=Roridomyces roridus TaxID=1738132 RepID=A0AAD7BRB6_9AGAR|nr:hypothetical protein FB45DRAFT_1082759 [Roridomyces roridus]